MAGKRKRSKSPEQRRNRFKFKSFGERIEDIDIDVFHTLDAVKAQPSIEGSSFFYESLIQWRESNASGDFIDLYAKLLPLVQTLPQLLLHKATVIKLLVSYLKPSSPALEPVFSLLAVFSRDLSGDFLPFIAEIFDGYHKLLQTGGDRDPIALQGFTLLAYIFKYMARFLSKDLAFVLKVTRCFRLYEQDYVRVFAAEAVSFVFKIAPLTQVIKGVRRLISETEKNPTDEKTSSCAILLSCTMKGPSSGFHSRAEELLKLLLSPAIICGVREGSKGQVVLEVLKDTLIDVCEETEPSKLQLLWSCLLDEMLNVLDEKDSDFQDKSDTRMEQLLSILNHLSEYKKGRYMNGQGLFLSIAPRLLNLVPKLTEESHRGLMSQAFGVLSNAISKKSDENIKADSAAASWTSAFDSAPSTILLPFIKRLLEGDIETVKHFQHHIIRALEKHFETDQSVVLSLLLALIQQLNSVSIASEKLSAGVADLLDSVLEKLKSDQAPEDDAAILTALRCFPYLCIGSKPSTYCKDFATEIDRCVKQDTESGIDVGTRASLLGAALASHINVLESTQKLSVDEFKFFLEIGLRYTESPEVLEAVSKCGLELQRLGVKVSEDLNYEALLRYCKVLEKNLWNPSKRTRIATLQILSVFQQRSESSQILNNLLALESTPLDIEHSRRLSSLILQVKMSVSLKPGIELVRVAFHALIGLLHNRFTPLWDPVTGCLAGIIDANGDNLRDDFMSYLSAIQHQCLEDPHDMSDLHESQMSWNLMTLLLRIAQKTSSNFASVSNEIVALFLVFVNHKVRKNNDERPSLGKNDWKTILKEWLQLLNQLKGFSGLPNAELLKQTLIERFLVFNDPDVQRKTLDCLIKWKDSYLTTYKDHLYKMLSIDTVRDELTSWSVSRDDQSIADDHRADLVPILVRILYPKLSKRNAKLGKSAGQMRSHILTFLSSLDVEELRTFFRLIVRPLEPTFCFNGNSDINLAWNSGADLNSFIDFVDKNRVGELPHKMKIGFLHLVKDILQVFDGEHLEPYLPALMGFVFRLLETASGGESIDSKQGSSGKDLRALCLKIITLILDNFNNVNLAERYWDVFFQAAERSIMQIKEDNTSEKPTAILSCFLAMSTNKEFTSLLGKSKLVVPNILSILLAKNLSSPVQSAVLSFIRSLLAMDRESLELIVLPHLSILLQGLTHQLNRQSSRKSWKTDHLKDQLLIISSVSPYIIDSSLASEFLNTLLPFLKRKKPDPEVRIEVLKIIRELAHLFDAASVSKCVQVFTPLLASVDCKESRVILCDSLEKFAAVDPALAPAAKVLVDLNSMSTRRLEESDYERRQAGYEKLDIIFLSRVDSREMLLLLSHIVFDLESEDMRYNASSCLIKFIKATGDGIFKDNVASSIHTFLFSRITSSIKSENTGIRREWLIILRELVILPDIPMFSDYRCLWSSDVEVDFFCNIIHIQLHRRVRAITKFRSMVSQLSQQSLTKVFAPLFLHFLFENKESNIIDAALDTLGCIAGQLEWSEAVNLVTDAFRLLHKRSDHQKVVVRLICLLLERTRFSQMGFKEHKYLEHKVLPQLCKLVLADDLVNVPVSVVAMKVLKLLPDQTIMKHLPQLFQAITNALKSRSQETRDQARASVVGMIEVLGSSYLQFAVKTLQSSLKRGYEKHVLGFTLNTVLIRLVPALQVGEIDYCLDEMIGILEDEIFGEVSAEKEIEALARKMKERKQARSYDTFRLLSQVATFDDDRFDRILGIVRGKNSSSSKVLAKLQLILKNITAGIQENRSAGDDRVLRFVRGFIEELIQPADSAPNANAHLLAEFGLNLLHDRLKRIQLQPDQALNLERFVPLLEKCLSLKYTGVVAGSMRCLCILLKMPLSTIAAAGEAIVNSVFSIAASSSNPDSPMMLSGMKLLSVILRHCKIITLSKHQVHELLRLNIFVEIEKQGSQCLSLLKAVVARKIVVAEVYDLMTRLQKLMITSQHQSIRQRCSEILLLFFLDYPIGAKRLQRHIDFLLGNLGYEHISGKEAALEMLHTIIVKFPDQVLREQSEGFFLTLITRLANDKDDNVRVLLQTVLRVLMERVGAEMLDHMKGFLLSWMTSEKQKLWLPATQVTGLLVDVMDKNFGRYLDEFWPAALKILGHSAEAHWRESFNVLVLIEKIFQRFPDRLSEDLWKSIQEFLLHRNVSVRTVSSRLFRSYLAIDTSSIFNDSRWIFFVGAICCEQITSEDVDQELGDHIVENLTTIAAFLRSITLKPDELEDEQVIKALTMLRQKPGTIDQLSNTLTKNDPLGLILRRLEKTSFEDKRAKLVLTWYKTLVRRLGREDSATCLPHILSPLLKVERSSAPVDVKTFAEEVREEIRELVGPENFAKAFSRVSLEVKERKEKRKRSKAIAALVDPEKAAKNKIKLGQKRGLQKKRRRVESSKP